MLKTSVVRVLARFAPLHVFLVFRTYLKMFLLLMPDPIGGGGLQLLKTNLLIALPGCKKRHEGGAMDINRLINQVLTKQRISRRATPYIILYYTSP